VKLYTADYAPNPRRVRWMMNEKGITNIELVPLDIMKLEHRGHPVIRRTGSDALPVLELDDETLIAESVAIGRYLESLYPEPNLFGRNARETAEIEMWTRRIEQKLATPLMLGTRMSFPALSVLEEPNPTVAAYMLGEATAFGVKLDAHLEGKAFICTDRVTIADIAAVCSYDFARIIRYRPDKSLVHLARWLEIMRALPSKPAV